MTAVGLVLIPSLPLLLLQERELQETRSQTDIPKMEEALGAMRSSKKKLDEKVSELQQELAVISRQSSSRGALEAFRKDKRSKEEQYQNEGVWGTEVRGGGRERAGEWEGRREGAEEGKREGTRYGDT